MIWFGLIRFGVRWIYSVSVSVFIFFCPLPSFPFVSFGFVFRFVYLSHYLLFFFHISGVYFFVRFYASRDLDGEKLTPICE